ncbi:permease [Caldithrix abyssi]
MEQKETRIKNKKSRASAYFLALVLASYLILAIFYPRKIAVALQIGGKLFIQIIPVLLMVLLVMALIDYFMKPQQIKKLLGKNSGIKGWIITIVFGIISHGSIYALYPLLRELKEQGMREGLIATFIYSRAIKLPFIPLLIYYFGVRFLMILIFYIIVSAVLEGLLIEYFQRK